MDPQEILRLEADAATRVQPPHRILFVFLAVIIVIVILFVAVWVFFFRSGDIQPVPIQEDIAASTSSIIGDTRVEVLTEDPYPDDEDRDGLTKEQELEYGTSDFEYDTDGDGINDAQEVMLWNTDPTNPDTDGDSFLDGFEILNRYNPKGDGLLP